VGAVSCDGMADLRAGAVRRPAGGFFAPTYR
jgi:hypothetical protein